MEEERFRDVGLFRYSLIRPLLDPELSRAERGALVRALAEAEHVGPGGTRVRVGRSTVDRWIRDYRVGGFEALVPRPRVVEPRTPARLLELAVALKRELPERTACQVHAIMVAAGEPAPTVRTLQRHFARLGLNVRGDGRTPDRVYGRFEAAARNELWTGDGLHGPTVGGRRAILLAFIDDYSRLLVGYRWGLAEDVLRLEAALRAGLAARGLPAAILVDRGSAFVSAQLARACAVLGIRLIHASPRAATTKGKIERFFKRVRGQFLVELERRELVFDPFDLERIEVRFQGRPLGLAVPVRIGRHTHPQARAEAKPPPPPTGIDYLGLLAARRDAELQGRPIDYRDLATDNDTNDDDADNETDTETDDDEDVVDEEGDPR